MQPPSPTPRSVVPLALGMWAVAMVTLGLTVATGQLWMLVGLGGVWVLGRLFADGGPPPRAAVRALQAHGHTVGFEGSQVRVVDHAGRRIRLHTPRSVRRAGRFVVSVSHALPLPDHTWVARSSAGLQSRHAPRDLRSRTLAQLPAAPGAAVVLTDEAVEVHFDRTDAARLPDHLDALVAWVTSLEDTVVRAICEDLHAAGTAGVHVTSGAAGTLVFRGHCRGQAVEVRFGRFSEGTPTWRGRPELHVHWADRARVFIGPCTRDVARDVCSVLAPGR